MDSPQAYIQLHPDDNVFVLIRGLSANEPLEINGTEYTLGKDLCLGHKVAANDIPAGQKVLKYGMSIGVASAPIRRGEHVHLHNLESEYTHTFTLDEGRRYD